MPEVNRKESTMTRAIQRALFLKNSIIVNVLESPLYAYLSLLYRSPDCNCFVICLEEPPQGFGRPVDSKSNVRQGRV